MDPLTAFGLAANIAQFIDFSSKLVSGAYEVYRSVNGATAENADLNTVIEDLNTLTERLNTSTSQRRTDDEKALHHLASECQGLSKGLLNILDTLKLENPNSKWDSLRISWENRRKEKELSSIASRLDRYRSQILLRVSIMIR